MNFTSNETRLRTFFIVKIGNLAFYSQNIHKKLRWAFIDMNFDEMDTYICRALFKKFNLLKIFFASHDYFSN